MVTDAEAQREELAHLNEADGPVFKIKKILASSPLLGLYYEK